MSDDISAEAYLAAAEDAPAVVGAGRVMARLGDQLKDADGMGENGRDDGRR